MTITTLNGITTDDFTTNTSGSYTTGHTDGGTSSTWTWDTTNARVTGTGGNDGFAVYSALTVQDMYVEIVTDQLENGGMVARHVDGNNTYIVYMNDSGAASNPNTWSIWVVVSSQYTQLASGSLAFTRGTTHTIRFEVVHFDLVLYFDGAIIGITGDTNVTSAGTGGMVAASTTGTEHFKKLSIGDFNNLVSPAITYPTDGYALYDYGSYMNSPTTYKARLDAIAAGGFKLVMNYSLIYDSTAHMLDYINYAYSKGMRVIVSLKDTFLWLSPAIQANIPIMYGESGNQATDAGFSAYVINQVKGLAGTWGYYVGDEVDNSNHAALKTHHDVIAAADNTKPILNIESWLNDQSSFSRQLKGQNFDCCTVGGDDYYPIPSIPIPTALQTAYGLQSFATFHGIQSTIALQAQMNGGNVQPTYANMTGWLASCLAYMQPRLILWFAYPDILASPNPTQFWSDLTAAIAAYTYHPPSNVLVRARSGASIVRARSGAIVLRGREP